MEVIEGTAVRLDDVPSDAIEIETQPGWIGETPVFMIFEPADGDGGNVGIDVDTPGWVEEHRSNLRRPGTWFLIDKRNQRPLFAMVVEQGDQAYFHKHHVGNLMSGGEIVALGLGKKAADGSRRDLWILPNGLVCAGDDVDVIASRMLGG